MHMEKIHIYCTLKRVIFFTYTLKCGILFFSGGNIDKCMSGTNRFSQQDDIPYQDVCLRFQISQHLKQVPPKNSNIPTQCFNDFVPKPPSCEMVNHMRFSLVVHVVMYHSIWSFRSVRYHCFSRITSYWNFT